MDIRLFSSGAVDDGESPFLRNFVMLGMVNDQGSGRRDRNPVGLARFGTGTRRDWFKGWLHMTTHDYSERYDSNPDAPEEEYI